MSYIPSENGTKVNMIKQKFEQNVKCETKEVEKCIETDESTTKELLRRSCSSSPVKAKRNLKLNVTRQLSNPGKNIKRTPAFRGDKLNKIRNLNSPSKEKIFSIVNQNVKIFEENPEYGKIGNVKRKLTESIGVKELLLNPDVLDENKTTNCDLIDRDVVDCIDKQKQHNETIKDYRPPFTKSNKIVGGNSVRTTVISRQKNISPIYSLDDDDGDFDKSITPSKDLAVTNLSSTNDKSPKFDKFLMNGVEYTKVKKPLNGEEKNFKFHDSNSPEAKTEMQIDIREELSRRKHMNISEKNTNNNSSELLALKQTDNNLTLELTNCLKAALEAPLPVGPPPKKPPRTFAHSPIIRRYNLEMSEECNKNNYVHDSKKRQAGLYKYGIISENSCDPKFYSECNIIRSELECNNFKELLEDESRTNEQCHGKISQDDNISKIKSVSSLSPIKSHSSSFEIDQQTLMTSATSTSSIKSRSTRDSKKMLEKLETVLIQHQKALGNNVIVPTKDKAEIEIDINNKKKNTNGSESDLEKNQDKRKFYNRLSRTLEDSKKIVSDKKNQESKNRKHSTFDCLPYLSCASSTVYEQPNFKTYFNEWSPVELKSRSEDSLDVPLSNVLTTNNIDSYNEHMSPAARRLSTELTTFLDNKRRQSISTKSEERVYAEPFAFDKNKGTDVLVFSELSPEEHNYLSRSWQNDRFNIKQNVSDITEKKTNSHERKKKEPELHYLCTTIKSSVIEDNNNATKPDEIGKSPQNIINLNAKLNLQSQSYIEGSNQFKVEELLNQAFGPFSMAGTELSTDSNTSSDTESIGSTPSSNNDEHSTSFNGKLQLFKNRENSVKPSKEELHRSLTEKRKRYVRKVSVKYSEKCGDSMRSRRDKLFDVCLLIELNFSTKEPYVKDKYPIYAQAPAWIENFCFPDAQDWPPLHSNHNQFYSLFLMDEKGNRRYGYCCRVKPEGGPILPLAYCLITKSRASGFYRKVLMELESRHGMPDRSRRTFIEELYNCTMPKPGNSITMTNKINRMQIISDSNSSENIDAEKASAAKFMESLNDSNSDESTIMRSGDPRLEERDMSQLFDAVSNKLLIFLFGSLLLERRVVLISENLSKLSSCVEALQSLLYPFIWPHTFIPVLPDIPELSEILHAPLPFVIGILKAKNSVNTQVNSVQDGMVVDIDTSKIICSVGDESTILPSRLQKGIRSALQLISNSTKSGEGMRNFLVSEAFLRVFVETCAHLESHLAIQQDGKVVFQKESFVNASGSKTVQYFLEWFVETTMFNTFIVDYIAYVEGSTVSEQYNIELFNKRMAEYRKTIDNNKQSKKSSSKKKTLGDRLKDLTNFYT
ncbi:hypothetical protein PV328_000542 [Microctonus aethiopoides]|uniref:UDENN domain-containing protein n=1 Tax=Microctonus aethiopoides TaxID=144406 RepID=A0AA39FV49_9HYME|nr:hypothetical protein PV328_000542 [Microctonus aethiopoides]